MLKKKKNNFNVGFTLLEVVVALILIAVGFLAIFTLHQHSLKSVYETTVREAVARQFSNYYEDMTRVGYEKIRREPNLGKEIITYFRLDGTEVDKDALNPNIKNKEAAFMRTTNISFERSIKSTITVEVTYTWGGLFSPEKTTVYSFALLKSGI